VVTGVERNLAECAKAGHCTDSVLIMYRGNHVAWHGVEACWLQEQGKSWGQALR